MSQSHTLHFYLGILKILRTREHIFSAKRTYFVLIDLEGRKMEEYDVKYRFLRSAFKGMIIRRELAQLTDQLVVEVYIILIINQYYIKTSLLGK